MSCKIPFSLVSVGWGRNWFSFFVEKTPTILPWGPSALTPCPGIVARAFPGLLTKRLERLELFTTVAMAMRAYQTVYLFGKFEVLKNGFFKFLAKQIWSARNEQSWASIRSNVSGETLANKPLRRSTRAQCEALPISGMALCIASTTTAGLMPVFSDWADKAVCYKSNKGPIGWSIRPARFSWRRSIVGLKFAPFRFRNFLIKESTFLGRKSS